MVWILDSTLREGEQTPGVYFDTHIKLAVAGMLDCIGVDFIEAGHPAVSTEIEDAVRQISGAGLNATVGAHSRNLKKDIDMAIACGAGFLGVFHCVSKSRLESISKKNIGTISREIAESIAYAKEKNPEIIVRYTPEDTARSDFGNVLKASSAAAEAGADIISVADTTGSMIPGTKNNMFDFVERFGSALKEIGLEPKIAVHCHNDRGLALANALDGFRAGAKVIDASVMGLGERAGIVDLAELLVVLKSDFCAEKNWNLKLLPELYSLVSRHSGLKIPVNFPVTGKNAFSHCAGVHTHAAVINPLHYQSLDPAIVGRKTEIALDHMSGIASVRYALREIGAEAENGLELMVLKKVKEVGHKGRTVDLEELKHIVSMCRQGDSNGNTE